MPAVLASPETEVTIPGKPFFATLRSGTARAITRLFGERATRRARHAFYVLHAPFVKIGRRSKVWTEEARRLRYFLAALVHGPAGGTRRRLLLIYDLSAQPFQIADIIVLQEAALILADEWALSEMDLAVVFGDDQHPERELASILPAAQINPLLASLFVFDNRDAFGRFLRQNARAYEHWPPAAGSEERQYPYHGGFRSVIARRFAQGGALPALSCRTFLREWARSFFAQYIAPRIPVTVDLAGRARDREGWLHFLRSAADAFRARFIVIASPAELDPTLRALPNVVVARDHLTTLEQNLALVEEAAFHLGESSGVESAMALFGKGPCLLVNTGLSAGLGAELNPEQADERLYFSSLSRHLVSSVGELGHGFGAMWKTLRLDEWSSASQEHGAPQAITWLR